MLKVFGIRHHGPGSAKRLRKALNEMQPDCVLIEGPAEAETMLRYTSYSTLAPPVAILIYNPNNLQQASYFPFAIFSPEWQAIQFGMEREIPIRFIDLPMAINFSLDQEAEESLELVFQTESPVEADRELIKDPLGYIAQIGGYADGERWWEVTFEKEINDQNLFQAVLDLIKALRTDIGRQESPRTLLREAYMRKQIRKAIKDGFTNIAVVCGAWHAPVLMDLHTFKQARDNAILKGLKKTKVTQTWIPWSYDRLAFESGYGAGVISPAWYELLFQKGKEVLTYWMIRVAKLLRRADLDASSAHVLEAVRLAQTLTTLRGKEIAGMEEMEEAALTVFCSGNEEQLNLIRNKLVIGEKVGQVPEQIPIIPLQKDLEKQIKSARLRKYWGDSNENWLKATATNPQGGIDLREPTDLLKSHLLHRLNLLDIPWGTLSATSENSLGSFKEFWRLKWQPDFSILIIKAGMWGNTLYEAATRCVKEKLSEIDRLDILTKLIEKALKADLKEAIDLLILHLKNLAALTKDISFLMDSLPYLVNIIRYGDARKTDISAVKQLTDQLIPRIIIGLPHTCMNIDENVAVDLFEKIKRTNRALNMLNLASQLIGWHNVLKQLSTILAIHPLIRGACLRILFDKGICESYYVGTQMSYALSRANQTQTIAQWLEGFLHGSGLLLIHHTSLWKILDNWVEQLSIDDFYQILPLLRRTFSDFSPLERQKILQLAQQEIPARSEQLYTSSSPLNSERAMNVLPAIQKILGIEEN